MRILAYLKASKATVLLIFILLVVQAVCELSLPAYFSDIVDVGIQQKGVDGAVPDLIRPETLDRLALFMTDDEAELARGAYVLNAEGKYVVRRLDPGRIGELSSILAPAMAALSQVEANGQMSMDTVETALSAGAVTKQQLLDMKNALLQATAAMGRNMIEQKAVLFVRAEYEAMGVDLANMQLRYVVGTGARMLGLTLAVSIAAVLVGLLSSRTAAQIGMRLRGQVFERVLSFSSAEIDKLSTASLITRSTNDVQQIQMATVMLLRVVLHAPILGIGGIIKVSSTRTGLEWIIAVALAAVMLLVLSLFSITMPKFKKMQVLVDKLNLVSREILTGIPVIRAFGREKYEEQRFHSASRELMDTQVFTNRAMSFMMPGMMLTMNVITVLIVWFGGKGVDLGNLQVGEMMAFITYTMQIVMSFMMLTMISVMLPRASVAASRVQEVLETQPSIRDSANVLYESRPQWNGLIEFRDVSFRFPGAEANVLEGISFRALPGQMTAIVGSTGSGKSTLVHLLLRFYDVTSGSIAIDGVDIRDISQKRLRSLIGFVPQKSVLFSGDIRSNIAFGADGLSDDEIAESARIAQVAEFIEQKPEKYMSPISQGGTNVSGGQRQRLSIARAIARNPRILILDDSFSALDYRTEVALKRALREKTKDTTVIVVAQRISTVLHADRIVVLDKGKVVGVGSHAELLETCPTYREIAQSQLSEGELTAEAGGAR